MGYSDGIWILWSYNNFNVQLMDSPPQFIIGKISRWNGDEYFFSCVYARPHVHLRRRLWSDLRVKILCNNARWVVLGDFNSLISKEEQWDYTSFNT